MAVCDVQNAATAELKERFIIELNTLLDENLGPEENYKDDEYAMKFRNELEDMYANMPLYTYNFMKPSESIAGTFIYLSDKFKSNYFKPGRFGKDKKRSQAIYKGFQHYKEGLEKIDMKDFGSGRQTVTLPRIIAALMDKFGILSSAEKMLNRMDSRKKNFFERETEKIGEAFNDIGTFFDNLYVGGQIRYSADTILAMGKDGKVGDGGIKQRMKDGTDVRIIDGIYDVDGKLKGFVVIDDNGKRNVSLDTIETGSVPIKDYVHELLKTHVTETLPNEIMEGEVLDVRTEKNKWTGAVQKYYDKKIREILKLDARSRKMNAGSSPYMNVASVEKETAGEKIKLNFFYILVPSYNYYTNHFDEDGNMRSNPKQKFAKMFTPIVISVDASPTEASDIRYDFVSRRNAEENQKTIFVKKAMQEFSDRYGRHFPGLDTEKINSYDFFGEGYFRSEKEGRFKTYKKSGEFDDPTFSSYMRYNRVGGRSEMSTPISKLVNTVSQQLGLAHERAERFHNNTSSLLKATLTVFKGLKPDIKQRIVAALDLDLSLNFDKNGDVRYINGQFQRKGVHYSPRKYPLLVYADIVKKTIIDMTNQRNTAIELGDHGKVLRLEEEMAQLTNTLNFLEHDNHTRPEKKLKYQKKRMPHMEADKRRKDGRVPFEYLREYGSTLVGNRAAITLMEATHRLQEVYKDNIPKADYMTGFLMEQYKAHSGTPFLAGRLGSLDLSYDGNLANAMGTALKMFGKDGTPEDINKFIDGTKKIVAFGTLFNGAPYQNRFQVSMAIINRGWDIYHKMSQLESSASTDTVLRKKLDTFLSRAGVGNALEMFDHILFKDSSFDSAYDTGPMQMAMGAPVKTFFDAKKLMRAGKKIFTSSILHAKKGTKEYDYKQKIITKLRYGGIIKGGSHQRQVEDWLNAYHDLQMEPVNLEKDPTTAELDRVKELSLALLEKTYTDIVKTKLNSVVNYRLSYGPNVEAEELFRFRPSERRVREQIAIMELIFMEQLDELRFNKESDFYKNAKNNGFFQEDNPWDNPILYDAVQEALHQFAFSFSRGDTAPYQRGIGEILFQYKNYPMNVVKHDYDLYKTFKWSGEETLASGSIRLTKAVTSAFGEAVGKDPNQELDEEALRFGRMLTIRMIATMTGYAKWFNSVVRLASSIPYAGSLFKTFQFGQEGMAKKGLGGMTNPFLDAGTRLLLMGLYGVMSDDDDWDSPLAVVWNIFKFMVFPPAIGILVSIPELLFDVFDD